MCFSPRWSLNERQHGIECFFGTWTSTENLVLDLRPKRVQDDCKVRFSDYSCLSVCLLCFFLMLIFYYLNHTSYFFVLKFCSFPSVREVLEVPSASFWWKPHAFKSSRFRVIQWTKGPKIIFFRPSDILRNKFVIWSYQILLISCMDI